MELEVRGHRLRGRNERHVSQPLIDLVERRIEFALGRFSGEIRRVDVKLADLSNTRGSSDKQCRVEVVLHHGGRIRAEGTDEHLRDAIDLATHRARRQLGRRLDREANPRRGLRMAG